MGPQLPAPPVFRLSTLMRDGKDLDATIEAVDQVERILIGEDVEATPRTDFWPSFWCLHYSLNGLLEDE